jgi:ATP-binding cassette, subfamily B, bacterial IrtA/YbtP
MAVLAKLRSYMTGRRALLPAALVLSAVSTLVGTAPYVLVWFIIRELFADGAGFSSGSVLLYAWWVAGTAIAGVVLYFAALSLSHLAAFRVEVNIRRYAMQKIVRMPLGFFDANTSGRIRKIIDDNASITHSFLAHQIPDLAATVLTPVSVLVLIFVFDWRLAIACLVPILFALLLMSSMTGERGRARMKLYMTSLEEMNTEAVEYVRGIPVVKVFQQTVHSFKGFYDAIMNYKNLVFGYTRMWQYLMSAYTVVINGFVFFLIPAALLIINATGDYATTILNVFLYVLITPMFSQSIMRSMYLSMTFGQASEAVDRVETLVSRERLVEPDSPRPMTGNAVQFRNVSFAYPGTSRKAIDGISFEIAEGTTVALVGPSGSGKTTIARLVPRFWDADEGQVIVGGSDVREIASEQLMKCVSFVFQNTRLFKTTLRENIRYGSPSTSVDEVERAIELSQCREIIDKLPNGLDTRIGVEGTYLSGGEQQRIILARAILKDAPIVVFDEATAFTDPENEHLIQRALKELSAGKTVLMIAHRMTSVVGADRILVIDDGRIAEDGTHRDLLARGGVYAGLWREYQRSVQWTIGRSEHA